MTKDDITPKQAEKLLAALCPTLGFLTQLEARLGELGFTAEDEYLRKLKAASEAYRRFTADTLKLSCGERGGGPAGR